MKIVAKKRNEMRFKDIPFGQVFRDEENLYMKAKMDSDTYITCSRCGFDIESIDKELEDLAVDLETGWIYQFCDYDTFEVVNGSFIEE